MIYREKIGLTLKARRKERKLSQTAAGRCAGIDHSVVSRIETGRYTGSLKTYERYLTSLGYVLTIQTEEPQQADFESLSELFDDE